MLQNIHIKNTGKRCYVAYKVGDVWHKESGGAGRIKDPVKRMEKLKALAREIEIRLSGEHYWKNNIIAALDRIISSKKLYQKKRSAQSTKSNLGTFKKYLIDKNLQHFKPGEITREIITDYINNELQRNLSTRTVNNRMIDIAAFFNEMVNADVIDKSPCRKINKLPTRSEKNVAFTETQVKEIQQWLAANDKYLQVFCKFIAYTFLRIDEIRELKISNLDLQKMVINTNPANIKQGQPQTKKIMKPLHADIKRLQLHKYPGNYYLFTNEGKPGPTKAGRNYFNRKFKVLKDKLGYSRLHTMYAIRHTFASNLVANGATTSELMSYFNHSTLAATEKYIRSLKAKQPADISNKFSIKI